MSELLANLPPKPEVDKLVRQFFDQKNFPIPVARKSPLTPSFTCQRLIVLQAILHEPTFMREVLNMPKFYFYITLTLS
jgi:hypothetical protein